MSTTPRMITLHAKEAWLFATEVLLAEPEALGDDVLESCLYILRDRLQGKDDERRFVKDFTKRFRGNVAEEPGG